MERKALEQKLTGFFEELHMHPELSYEEYETTERIKRELAAAGIEILQIPLKTGVTAIVRGAKPGKRYGRPAFSGRIRGGICVPKRQDACLRT